VYRFLKVMKRRLRFALGSI